MGIKHHRRTALATMLVMALVPAIVIGAGHNGPKNEILQKPLIVCQINYDFAIPGQLDDEGRELKWVGNISGDIEGSINWWFNAAPTVAPSMLNAGAGFIGYYSARWEILDESGEVILAGESGGKTVFPMAPPALDNGVWDGHGIVTEASKCLNTLKGSKIYESGSVVVGDSGLFKGNGIFLIAGP